MNGFLLSPGLLVMFAGVALMVAAMIRPRYPLTQTLQGLGLVLLTGGMFLNAWLSHERDEERLLRLLDRVPRSEAAYGSMLESAALQIARSEAFLVFPAVLFGFAAGMLAMQFAPRHRLRQEPGGETERPTA